MKKKIKVLDSNFFLNKKADITLPATLGLILSAIVLLIVINASCTIIDFSDNKNKNNFNEVTDFLTSFSDDFLRGSTISNQYPLILPETGIFFGINPNIKQIILDYSFFKEDNSKYLDKHLEIPRPSNCRLDKPCFCYCEEFEIINGELVCEKYPCSELSETTLFYDYLFKGNIYLKRNQLKPVNYTVDSKGGFLMTHFGLIGGFYDDVDGYVFSQESFKLQWLDAENMIAVCDNKNILSQYNACVD